MACICIISYRPVTAGSQYHWYLLSRLSKYKYIMVIDTYNTTLQLGTQINTVLNVILIIAVMAWANISLMWWVDWIMIRQRWGRLLIERRGGLWTALQSRLLTVLGLYKTVSTES